MPAPQRGTALTILAILFGILAVSDIVKPFQFGGDQTGFVFFGKRLSGTPNMILGPLFGLYLLAYAAGIWTMRRFALTMAWIYVAYVIANLVLFNFRTPPPPGAGVGWQVFGIVYAIVAIGVSVGTARLLSRRQADLR